MPDSKPTQKFFNACSTGKASAVAEYIEAGVKVDARDKYNLTGLMWSARKGRIQSADILISSGADIEATDNTGRTALFHAVTYKRYEFVEYMASKGANLSPIDMHGWSPLDFSRCSVHKKMQNLLVDLGARAQKYDAI